MAICFYKQHCKKGEFDQSFINEFFRQHSFIPMKELVYSVEEDKKKLFINYNVDDVDILDDMPITRNIWCFDKKTGERLWAIAEYPRPKGANPIGPYGGPVFNEAGELRVFGSNVSYEVNHETGEIGNPVFTK
jgi:hypothetical protein